MIPPDRLNYIKGKAEELLSLQNITCGYSLHLFDYTSLVCPDTVCDSIENYEKLTGGSVNPLVHGLERPLENGMRLVFYRQSEMGNADFPFTVLHEYGHALLNHDANTDKKTAESEADAFARSFLMPEFMVRYLDLKNGRMLEAKELKKYFPLEKKQINTVRKSINGNGLFVPSARQTDLLSRFFNNK